MDAALPIKLFDAMASARPVVATDGYESSNLINEEKCGLVATDDSPQTIGRNKLLSTFKSCFAQELGGRGRQSVEKRHSWHHRAKTIKRKFWQLSLDIPS